MGTTSNGGEPLLLVDYENVQNVDLRKLAAGWRVMVFVGSAQKSLPFDLVQNAQGLGGRLTYVKSDLVGPNALDFMIAYTLGQELAVRPQTPCIILSKDHGFDPLVKHLVEQGLECRRVNSQLELQPAAPRETSPDLKRVLDVLGKSPKQARPRKRDTLAKHIASILRTRPGSAEVGQVIDLLFRDSYVSETAGKISYSF
jgi:hypothetical protein